MPESQTPNINTNVLTEAKKKTSTQPLPIQYAIYVIMMWEQAAEPIINLISTVLCATYNQPKRLKPLKLQVYKLKFTCFGQYGNHHVLKCFAGETASFAVTAVTYPTDAQVCGS
jgi:hypothetical protein